MKRIDQIAIVRWMDENKETAERTSARALVDMIKKDTGVTARSSQVGGIRHDAGITPRGFSGADHGQAITRIEALESRVSYLERELAVAQSEDDVQA